MIVGGEAPYFQAKHEIRVIGIGGGGCNAVSYLYTKSQDQEILQDVDYLVANLDSQALHSSPVPNRLRMGNYGAGANPEEGRKAAKKHAEAFRSFIQGAKLLFIAAGMGGGTGTGAAPEIARIAKEMNVPTVAVITLPFRNEGNARLRRAARGVVELFRHVPSILIIDNERLRKKFPQKPLEEGFKLTDKVLAEAVESIVYVIRNRGKINVDINDVRSILQSRRGPIGMGQTIVNKLTKVYDAVQEALEIPFLLEDKLHEAQNFMIYIAYGSADNQPTFESWDGPHAEGEVIYGYGHDPSLGDRIQVIVLAAGFPYDQDLYTNDTKLFRYLVEGNRSAKQPPSLNFVEGIDWKQFDTPAYKREGLVLGRGAESEGKVEEIEI